MNTNNINDVIHLRKELIGDSLSVFFPNDPLLILRGNGTYLYDQNDKRYLDCINNVATVGHCHPRVVEASNKQKKLLETNSRFLHPNIVKLGQRLKSLFPDALQKFYFLNSGSEATDLALLLAFYYTQGTDVIVLDHAYHGHLCLPMSISPYKFQQPGGMGKKEWVHIAPCPDIYRGIYNIDNVKDNTHVCTEQQCNSRSCDETFDYGLAYAQEIEKIIQNIIKSGRKLAAFICESMLSCGGQIILPPNYLSHVYDYVHKAGGVCIADEIQSGYGRCGEYFSAFQLQNVVPDIVTIGKPMGNGHPIAALVTTNEISKRYASSNVEYFNTYGGNPVSCAIALTVLDVIKEENLIENSKVVGAYLKKNLMALKNKYPVIGDVRGVGLFIGIEMVKDCKTKHPDSSLSERILNMMKGKNVIVSREGPYRNVLKIKPPLCFSLDDSDEFLFKFESCLQAL